MSKSLRSFSGRERQDAIGRRLADVTKGLGYWAAHDAQHNFIERGKRALQMELNRINSEKK